MISKTLIEGFASDMLSAVDIFREQLTDRNAQFMRKFAKASHSNIPSNQTLFCQCVL